MTDTIETKGVKIPASFHIFFTLISLFGVVGSILSYLLYYFPINESKTPYGIIITSFLIVSAIVFIYSIKRWKKIDEQIIKDEEEKRKLDLEKKRLENQKLKDELEANDGVYPTLTNVENR